MGEPPSYAGAIQETVARPLLAVALRTIVGALGAIGAGVARLEWADSDPVPTALVAATVKA
jgi:hypothetical protein